MFDYFLKLKVKLIKLSGTIKETLNFLYNDINNNEALITIKQSILIIKNIKFIIKTKLAETIIKLFLSIKFRFS